MTLAIPRRSIRGEHIDIGAISAEHLGIHSAGYSNIPGSTTDTVNWTRINSIVVPINLRKAMLIVSQHISLKHTVADAIFDFRVALWNDAGGSVVVATDSARNTILPAPAGVWYTFDFVAGFDINFLAPTMGQHLLSLEMGPVTAGTLSWGEPSSGDGFQYELVGQR